jgi:hypothetical protein
MRPRSKVPTTARPTAGAVTRKVGLGIAGALLLATGWIGARLTAPIEAAQQPSGTVFKAGAGLLFNIVKPEKAADFEAVIGRIKDAMQKAEAPLRKQQAAGWKVFKALEPDPKGNVMYIFVIDPAIKDADYTITQIMGELLPTEAQQLYEKIKDAFVSRSMVNLELVADFSGR